LWGSRDLSSPINGCPCGFYGDPQKDCTCSTLQIQRYRARISGPLLDRIDIQVEVPAVRYKELADQSAAEPSAVIRARAYTRILKVSRTIADLDGLPEITAAQVAEAIQYRSLDRSFH
jgi:magnesium chelatase family protein